VKSKLCVAFCAEEFDEKVQESKLEADEALKKIPEIERMINNAEQMTRETRDSLEGAERDADVARDLAERAKNIAENIGVVSGKRQRFQIPAREVYWVHEVRVVVLLLQTFADTL